MDVLAALRVVLGSVLILFVPGLSWSYLFLRSQDVGIVGRVATSFGLSLVLVPLVVFWLNLTLGVEVTLLNVGQIIFVLSAIPPAYLWVRAYRASRGVGGGRENTD